MFLKHLFQDKGVCVVVKLLRIFIACCIVIGIVFYAVSRSEQSPESTVKAYFAAVKATDYENAYKYVYPMVKKNPITLYDQREIEVLRMFMSRTSFNVIQVTNAEDGTHVIVKVDMPDIEWCWGMALYRIPKQSDSVLDLAWVNMKKIMKQGVRMASFTQELLVKKQNGKMVIINNDKKLFLSDPRLVTRMLIMPRDLRFASMTMDFRMTPIKQAPR